MLVTKSKAADIAGVSRRTLYNHIPQKRISVIVDDDGNEKIDIAELERVYGKETIQRNLKDALDAQGIEASTDVQSSQSNAPTSVKFEVLLLKERMKNLEDQKNQLERFHHRERQQLQEEIENLRDGLKKAQDHHSQLSLLLTDQRKDKESRGGEQEKKLQALEATVEELKKQNRRILFEVQKKNQGFFGRFLGLSPKTAKA